MNRMKLAENLVRIARYLVTEDVMNLKIAFINGKKYYTDGNNYVSVQGNTLEQALDKLNGMSECSDCTDCSGCTECDDCSNCVNCHGCNGCDNCTSCFSIDDQSGKLGMKGRN